MSAVGDHWPINAMFVVTVRWRRVTGRRHGGEKRDDYRRVTQAPPPFISIISVQNSTIRHHSASPGLRTSSAFVHERTDGFSGSYFVRLKLEFRTIGHNAKSTCVNCTPSEKQTRCSAGPEYLSVRMPTTPSNHLTRRPPKSSSAVLARTGAHFEFGLVW